MIEPNPITYRMLHEDAAGMGLCPEFFTASGINPDAPVICNCNFDAGHEPTCDMVAALELRRKMNQATLNQRRIAPKGVRGQ